MDLWLVDSILYGRKVNLGFLIVQHMANVLASVHSVLQYGILLTTIFRHFEIDLDGETDICICKTFDAINHSSISHLGYELERNQWVLKTTRVPATIMDKSDKKAAIDTPPPSPMATPSRTIGVGSSAAPFYYVSAFQNLFECLDTIFLDVQ